MIEATHSRFISFPSPHLFFFILQLLQLIWNVLLHLFLKIPPKILCSSCVDLCHLLFCRFFSPFPCETELWHTHASKVFLSQWVLLLCTDSSACSASVRFFPICCCAVRLQRCSVNLHCIILQVFLIFCVPWDLFSIVMSVIICWRSLNMMFNWLSVLYSANSSKSS